jgi:hypothetical protein
MHYCINIPTCIFIKGTVQQEKNCLKVVLFDRPYVALDH